MHTLIFDSHTAILDPLSGMGLLVLPDPTNDSVFDIAYLTTETAPVSAERWYGSDSAEYTKILSQLASIDWELPMDDHGRPTWLDAGCTDCCGRSMISLEGPDAEDVNARLQQLVETAQQMQELAALGCCGLNALVDSMIQ